MNLNNSELKAINSDFDEVDMTIRTDQRFDEAIAAADAGEYDLADSLVRKMAENGTINLTEDSEAIEYNPEDDDAMCPEDCMAEDIRELASENDYDDEDGELIDSVMGDDYYE